MSAILVLVGSTVGATLGWWVGERVGLMTAYFLSVVGMAAGVYVVRRWLAAYGP